MERCSGTHCWKFSIPVDQSVLWAVCETCGREVGFELVSLPGLLGLETVVVEKTFSEKQAEHLAALAVEDEKPCRHGVAPKWSCKTLIVVGLSVGDSHLRYCEGYGMDELYLGDYKFWKVADDKAAAL